MHPMPKIWTHCKALTNAIQCTFGKTSGYCSKDCTTGSSDTYYPDAIEIDCHGKVGACSLAVVTIQSPVRDNGRQWSHEPVSNMS